MTLIFYLLKGDYNPNIYPITIGGRGIQDVSHFLEKASICGFLHILERARGCLRNPGQIQSGVAFCCYSSIKATIFRPGEFKTSTHPCRVCHVNGWEAVLQKLVPVLPLSDLLTTPLYATTKHHLEPWA